MDACTWTDAKAKQDGDAFGKELVEGNNGFLLLLDKHYGPNGDRKCAAPAFLDELSAYEQAQLGRTDVALVPTHLPPEKGQFSSPYPASDGTTKGYTVELTNIYANASVQALKAGALPDQVNIFITGHLNDNDAVAFKTEFDRRKGTLPWEADVIGGTDVLIGPSKTP